MNAAALIINRNSKEKLIPPFSFLSFFYTPILPNINNLMSIKAHALLPELMIRIAPFLVGPTRGW